MNRLFSLDNPFMQFLSKVFDLLMLNIIFIISCIPVFTIGAALSALYTVALKMVRDKDTYIVKGYFTAFAHNFKQSTVLWLLCIVLFFFFRYDYMIASSMDSSVFQIVRIVLLMMIFLLTAAFLYLFPIASHFVCTTRQVIKNAFLMCIGHLPYTLILFAYYGAIWFLCTRSVKIFGFIALLSMFCGFSVTAFVTSIVFSKVFKKYEPEETDD